MAGFRVCATAYARFFCVDVVTPWMAGEMRFRESLRKRWYVLPIVAVLVCIYVLAMGVTPLLTPVQQGFRDYERGDFEEAAIHFADPMWRGVALFKAGKFADSAGVFVGIDTAESAFNQGNALVMQGQYEDAVEKYARAIDLRPGWEDAAVNRDIATARAAMLKQEGGDMTGGMLAADEIVFGDGKSPQSAGDEQVEAGQDMSDTELRAVWLRQVQTKPADFLAAKFAYQYATRPAPGNNQGEVE